MIESSFFFFPYLLLPTQDILKFHRTHFRKLLCKMKRFNCYGHTPQRSLVLVPHVWSDDTWHTEITFRDTAGFNSLILYLYKIWYQNDHVEKQDDAGNINHSGTISHLAFNRCSGLTGLHAGEGWNYFSVSPWYHLWRKFF